MKSKNLIIAAAIVAGFAGLFYFYRGHQAPSGQPALVNLTAANFGQLKQEFNRAQQQPRVILLLSPT